MKKSFFPLLGLLCAWSLRAQSPIPPAGAGFTSMELAQLCGPIALYPDRLVALILPAAAEDSDVVLAARYFDGGGRVDLIDRQGLSPTIAALGHYPQIIHWLDSNLSYTQALGDAFRQQPEEVMRAIQQLRMQALSAGSLVSTAQQIVYVRDGIVVIEPAQADCIYVPTYDPVAVYVGHGGYGGYGGGYLSFGAPCAIGPWLDYRCDWVGFSVFGSFGGVGRSRWVAGREWRPEYGERREGAGWAGIDRERGGERREGWVGERGHEVGADRRADVRADWRGGQRVEQRAEQRGGDRREVGRDERGRSPAPTFQMSGKYPFNGPVERSGSASHDAGNRSGWGRGAEGVPQNSRSIPAPRAQAPVRSDYRSYDRSGGGGARSGAAATGYSARGGGEVRGESRAAAPARSAPAPAAQAPRGQVADRGRGDRNDNRSQLR